MVNKKAILLVLVLAALIAFRISKHYLKTSKNINGEKITCENYLLEEPKIVNSLQRLTISCQDKGPITVTTTRYPSFHYGDFVTFSGTVKTSVLHNKKVVNSIYFPEVIAEKKGSFAVVGSLRQTITNLFQKSLPSASASLLLGIVFGIKDTLPKTFSDELRVSGVYHIVAASGMNVSMVAIFLSTIFGFIFKRQIALLASILGILFYVSLAGFESSILRAAIMGILVFTAQILGRQTLAIYSLCLAGYFMILFDPEIISDIGFQLSFLATLGLIYLRPHIEFEWLGKSGKLGEILAADGSTTLAAQLATLPILLSNFGTFSPWSIFTNLLVLWTVPFLMVIGGAGAIIGLVFAPLGQLVLLLALPLLSYIEMIVSISAHLPGIVQLTSFPVVFGLAYYCVLAAWLLKKR